MKVRLPRNDGYPALASLALYVTGVLLDSNFSFITSGFIIVVHVSGKVGPVVRHRLSALTAADNSPTVSGER
jgi:hypothetical protein